MFLQSDKCTDSRTNCTEPSHINIFRPVGCLLLKPLLDLLGMALVELSTYTPDWLLVRVAVEPFAFPFRPNGDRLWVRMAWRAGRHRSALKLAWRALRRSPLAPDAWQVLFEAIAAPVVQPLLNKIGVRTGRSMRLWAGHLLL